MSKSFQVACGGLLLLTAATILVIQAAGVPGDPLAIRVLVAVFALPGALLLAFGLQTPFSAEHQHVVKRKLTPKNLLLGPIVIAASAAVLFLTLRVLPVAPDSVILLAMAGVLAGVFLTASVQGDACVRCDRLLEGVAHPLPPDADGVLAQLLARGAPAGREVSFLVCLHCHGVAVWRTPKNTVVVVTGPDAEALAALASAPTAIRRRVIFT